MFCRSLTVDRVTENKNKRIYETLRGVSPKIVISIRTVPVVTDRRREYQ